jgi:hypothetical protein
VVSTRPEARRRLAALMEERRLDLGLRWQDVVEAADAAGFKVSLKALHSVRTGNAGIRPLTRRAIEAGLQWEHGSIQRIEDGGDPVPAASEPVPVTAAGTVTLPPMAAAVSVESNDDVRGAVAVALYAPQEKRIWVQIRRRLALTPAGSRLFADPGQAAAWPPGSAPLEMTPEARALLGATPADVLFDATAEVVVWNLDLLPYRKRVEMIRAYREPILGAGTARRAGLRKPDGLTA